MAEDTDVLALCCAAGLAVFFIVLIGTSLSPKPLPACPYGTALVETYHGEKVCVLTYFTKGG